MSGSTPKLFCIGDLHGHMAELTGLMQLLYDRGGLVPERDTVIQLGDMVDGGPHSKQVVEWCMAMAGRYPHWVFLYANHEDLLLDALRHNSRTYGDYRLWWDQGGRATAHSYLPADATDYERAIMQPRDVIPTAHLAWLETRPLYHETDRYIFVHAGLRPGIPLTRQTTEDLLWIRDTFIASEHDFGKVVVFGHTPMKGPLVMPNKIGIDTMTFDRGKLTAVELSGPEPVFYFYTAVEGPWPEPKGPRRRWHRRG